MSTQTKQTCSVKDVMSQLGSIHAMQIQQRDLLHKIHSVLTLMLIGVAVAVLGGGGWIATTLFR